MNPGSSRIRARRAEIGERLDAIAERRAELAPRLAEIGERLDAIDKRMKDLAQRAVFSPGACQEQLRRPEAEHLHAAAARAAAYRELEFAARAYVHSAQAHDEAADGLYRAAALGWAERSRQAARHRAAATAERQRARRARVLSGARLTAPAVAG